MAQADQKADLLSTLPEPVGPDGQEIDIKQFLGMITGELYKASDPYIRIVAKSEGAKVEAINREMDETKRIRLFREFMRLSDDVDFYISTPIFAEYGFNLSVGTGTYIGPNCYFLNVSPIVFGERVLVGPNVQFYAATHPLDPAVRDGKYGPEYSKKITVEDDVWIAGAAVICPGVTIGKGSTVAAGAVVTKDVPPRCVVGGNPAKVIKYID